MSKGQERISKRLEKKPVSWKRTEEAIKQDCESMAFVRLAEKIKKLPIAARLHRCRRAV